MPFVLLIQDMTELDSTGTLYAGAARLRSLLDGAAPYAALLTLYKASLNSISASADSSRQIGTLP